MSQSRTPKEEIINLLKEFSLKQDTSKLTANYIATILNLDQATVRKYCKQLKIQFLETGYKKKNKSLPITIDGILYPSINAASQGLNIHPNTLHYRISQDQQQKAKERYESNKSKHHAQVYLATSRSFEIKLLDGIKRRISTNDLYKNLECTLTQEDIRKLLIIQNCPICNVLLEQEINNDIGDAQPSVDRINSKQGYTAENIRIVCYRCNTNHRADLFQKKCSCSSWLMSHYNFCFHCGKKIEHSSFDENWNKYLQIKDRVLTGEQLDLDRKKRLFAELKNKHLSLKGNIIPSYRTGLMLVDSFFPNRFKAHKSDQKSFHSYISDSLKMKQVIELMTKEKAAIRPGLVPDYIRKASNYKVARVYNFRPTVAKLLVDKFVPEGGIVYDYSSGFGGRLLGAMASEKNVSYIGIDPNTETYSNLLKLRAFLINDVQLSNKIDIQQACSEEFCPDSLLGKVDMAFSSPPYYDLEQYSDELTQCYRKFPSYPTWKEHYLKVTIRNIYSLLKATGLFVINIKNTNYELATDTLEIASQAGFVLHETLMMELSSRSDSQRLESIFIFKKII